MDFDMDSDGDYDGDYDFDADGGIEMDFEGECDGDDDLDYEVETDDYDVEFDQNDGDPEIQFETNAPEAESDGLSATYSWDQGEPHQTGIRHSRFTDDMGDGRHNRNDPNRSWSSRYEYQDPGYKEEEEDEKECEDTPWDRLRRMARSILTITPMEDDDA